MTESRPPRVLVVEDDPASSEVLATVLDEAGYATVTAESLSSAREHLEERASVDCIVLDLNLPDGTAEEFLRCMRDSGPPTVIISGAVDAGMIASRFGVALLRKPYDIDAVVAAVRIAISHNMSPRDSDPT